MAQTLPTSEVLNLAADAIERNGWGRGSASWPRVDKTAPAELCIEGGIAAALGIRLNFGLGVEAGGVGYTEFRACPAYVAVTSYLTERGEALYGMGDMEPNLWRFNDAKGRTAAEVIEVLRATAAIEAAREDAALLAEIGRA